MTKHIPTVVTAALIAFSSCNNAPTEETATPVTAAPPEKKPSKACYEYINKKDTVLLKVTSDGDKVTGTLSYNFFEKDKNTGTIVGQISNNLLIADYTFMSEGVQSTRQVAFKKSGSQVTEGYGDVVTDDKDNNVHFKNIDSLNFSNSIVLKEIGCE